MFYCLSLGVYAGAKKGAYSDKMLRERIESKGQKDMPIDAVTEEMLEALASTSRKSDLQPRRSIEISVG